MWHENMRNGEGTCQYLDGGLYKGSFKNEKRHGQGSYTMQDGQNYNGHWDNDVKQGKGTYTWADGTKFVGQFWKGDIKSGILTDPEGNKKKI